MTHTTSGSILPSNQSRNSVSRIVLPATAEELEAHTRQLEMIEKESKGKCLWRQLELAEMADAAEPRVEVEARLA